MMEQSYESENVRIRPITMGDTQRIVCWRNTPQVRRNFVYQAEMTAQTHEKWMRGPVAAGTVKQFIIEEKQTNRPVGSVYLRDIDSVNEKAEYGIFIGESDARGKGYGTQAARLILQFAFQELHLHRVFLRVFADNPQAIRSYEKVGFVREGLFRHDVKIDGVYKDMVFMAIVQ